MATNSGSIVEDSEKVPEQFRKVFVGGIDAKTTDDSLKSYFEQYGEVVDYVVVTHPVTKRHRGFGFVTYKYPSSVDAVQEARPHKVDGRAVETKRAMPKDDDAKPESKVKVNKIFVGGVKEDVDEEQLRNYFSTFGNVTSVHIITKKGSDKKRGFAFVEFDDYDPVDKIVLKKVHPIGDRRTEVKKALSKQQIEDLNRSKNRGQQNDDDDYYGGGRGGGGGYNGRSTGGGYSGRGGGGGGSFGRNQGSSYGGNQGGRSDMGEDDYCYGDGGGYGNHGMNMDCGGYDDFGSDYNNTMYGGGPMRGNQFMQRNQGPYGGGGGGGGGRMGGGRFGRGGGGGGGGAGHRRY